jgi:hypothetical protein
MSVGNYETGETDLLDGATGKLVSGGDLAEASHRLDFFASQISDQAYELFIRGDNDDLTVTSRLLPEGEHRTIPNMFHSFDDRTVHAEIYDLHTCSPACRLAVHPDSSQN